MVAGFAALLLAGAVQDLRQRRIANLLTAAIAALWPLHVLLAPFGVPAIWSLAVAAAALAAGFGLFALGLFGGGDIKMLVAVLLWAGPDGAPLTLLAMALAGGILGVAMLAAGRRRSLPYGVAIAAGGFVLAASWLAAIA